MVLLVFCGGCATRISEMKPLQRSELLATEQGKLSESADPVSRAKSYITISEVLLSFASDAVKESSTPLLNRRLEQYVSAVEKARDTIVTPDRNGQRYSVVFKELEEALRRHLRLLHELRPRVVPENRDSVEHALTVATSVRDEMLALLVPGGQR
jgi:diphthamide synthase subunit DPH2